MQKEILKKKNKKLAHWEREGKEVNTLVRNKRNRLMPDSGKPHG